VGIRFQNDGETEVACALALLQELDRQLGRRLIDFVREVYVGDPRVALQFR
jgi:hypothetical protein